MASAGIMAEHGNRPRRLLWMRRGAPASPRASALLRRRDTAQRGTDRPKRSAVALRQDQPADRAGDVRHGAIQSMIGNADVGDVGWPPDAATQSALVRHTPGRSPRLGAVALRVCWIFDPI